MPRDADRKKLEASTKIDPMRDAGTDPGRTPGTAEGGALDEPGSSGPVMEPGHTGGTAEGEDDSPQMSGPR